MENKITRYELWKFFADEHNLITVESELEDIIIAVEDYILPKNKLVRKLVKFLMRNF